MAKDAEFVKMNLVQLCSIELKDARVDKADRRLAEPLEVVVEEVAAVEL